MKRRFDSSLINFLKELKSFHGNSGTSIVSFPSISGHVVNLYKLFKTVSANGGYDKVSYEDKWSLVVDELGIPEDCANACEVVKQIYQRYLERYERARKKDGTGLVTDYDVDELYDEDISRGTQIYKSRRSESFLENRMSYTSDASRVAAGPANPIAMPPNFYRLYRSLLCGLPNEFDLGVSACLALSLNDSRIPLLPNHFTLFVDLLCAHAGIFGEDSAKLASLYADWRKCDKLEFFNFWTNFIDDELNSEDSVSVKDLLYSPGISPFLEDEVYKKKSSLSVSDRSLEFPLCSSEGFVVEMIASVFRNLSFEAYNAALMANNPTLLRFLLLGSRCRYRNVSALCLDTIARLAPSLTLSTLDLFVDCGASLLTDFLRCLLESTDRAHALVGAEILASLCQNDSNFDELCSFIDSSLCNKLFQYLLVPDINLVVNCAEAIYQISELGPSPCDIIAANEHHLTMVLALTTIEAVAFGPDALVNIKVVVQPGAGVPSVQPIQQRHQPKHFHQMPSNFRQFPQQFVQNFPPPSHTTYGMSTQIAPSPYLFASNWLRTVFELVSVTTTQGTHGGSESLIDVYNEYLNVASRTSSTAVFENAQHFMDCIIRTFPFVSVRSPPPGSIDSARIYGLRRICSTSAHAHTFAGDTMVNSSKVPPSNGHCEKNLLSPNGASPLADISKRSLLPKSTSDIQKTAADNAPVHVASNGIAATVKSASPGAGVLHVVGTPITAGDMIERERSQHELAIVRVENKPTVLKHNGAELNGEKKDEKELTNGNHDSSKSSTLDRLLESADDKKPDDVVDLVDIPAVTTNGAKSTGATELEKRVADSSEECRTKSVNGAVVSPHLNGFVHTEVQNSETNGYHPSDGDVNDHQPSADEVSLMSADSNSRSGAVFASCVDSESAASFGGGDTSQMSVVSDIDSREAGCTRRHAVRSCPSVNNDSRSGLSVGVNPLPPSVRTAENENSAPSNSNFISSTMPSSVAIPPPPNFQQKEATASLPLPFLCYWASCQESFASSDALHRHFVAIHISNLPSTYGFRSPCLWKGCMWPLPRLKWSLLSHVKDLHFNANSGGFRQRVSYPECEIPPDAGLRAVLTNFCQTTPFHPPMPGFEGPVTKQMRLAGGLILRNIAKHSANGKRFIHRHMHELVAIAFAGIESSSAISAALDLADQPLL